MPTSLYGRIRTASAADIGGLRKRSGLLQSRCVLQDARKYIPDLSERRCFDPAVGLSVLEEIGRMVESVDRSLYEDFENLARERVLTRDPDDWPIVAVALLLDFPIWTEDQDFFGSGVATWTTDRVELYLR
jgi:predicted nucleic acid-binding protein